MKSIVVVIILAIAGVAKAQTDSSILKLDSSIFKVKVMVYNPDGAVAPMGIRPGYSAKKRDFCPNYDSVRLLSYNGDDFYKVEYKPTGMPLQQYYIHIRFLRSDPWAVTFINNFQISQGNAFRLFYVEAPPDNRNSGLRSF